MIPTMIPRPVASSLAAFLGLASVAGFAAGPAYPLEAGPTGRYLVDQKGTPVFINGDTPWSLASPVSREDVELYLKHRATLGMNSLIITVPEGFYCDGCRGEDGPRDFYGHKPFLTENRFTAYDCKRNPRRVEASGPGELQANALQQLRRQRTVLWRAHRRSEEDSEAHQDGFHQAADAVRYQMNALVIAVGCYVGGLTELAIQIGEKIGPVTADLGNNDCQVPCAPDYIRRVQQRGAIGKKRKSAKC